MKQQIPMAAIIGAVVVILGLVGFFAYRTFGDDGHGSVSQADVAKYRRQQQGAQQQGMQNAAQRSRPGMRPGMGGGANQQQMMQQRMQQQNMGGGGGGGR